MILAVKVILTLLLGRSVVEAEECQHPPNNSTEPCPPCPNSTWTYVVSDLPVDNAMPIEAPHWLECHERMEGVHAPYGTSLADLGTGFDGDGDPDGPPKFPVDVVMMFQSPAKCDVQVIACPPPKTIGCDQKIMLAHEEEYRRQCKETFVKNFEYELERDQFDPDMAAFWLEDDPDFVRMGDNGKLLIMYDYTTFGCPLEPYQDDHFAPDLRILTEDMNKNTSLGLKYNNSYILIEIFGASGFKYDKTAKESGCLYPPQRRESLVKEWKANFRPTQRVHSPNPLHIWNKSNYKPCNETWNVTRTGWENEEYEIMNNKYNKTMNTLEWSRDNRRPKVLVFLAVAIDDECPFYTLFGVSLPKATELDPFLSLIWFVGFTILWVVLVVLGYYCRKSQIRKQYYEEARAERLKQAAWAVIYRYEKLLHESENKQLENEMTDYARKLDKEERKKMKKGREERGSAGEKK
ncbi:uncharacterized protein LOC118436488 [Folsomia candida]|uniref:uncharacterized protein LOC118436488 n=1 Tax=Folsomia candida TaxID=158441 RepID=UPI0016050E22|nr:uncharacterized protein LOC118436488 [Folsomia candida]